MQKRTPTSLAAGDRLTELLLGIAANLCCHTQLAPALAADAVFVEAVVATLLSCAYAPALTEACRALDAALSSGCPGAWAAALLRPAALERLVWVAENTRVHDLRNRCTPCHATPVLDTTCTARALRALGPAADVISRPHKVGTREFGVSRRGRQLSTLSSRVSKSQQSPAAPLQEPGHPGGAGRLGSCA